MKYVVTDNGADAICTRLYKKYPIAGFDEFHDDLREAIAQTLGEPVAVPDDGEELMCCNGVDCGCQGVTKGQYRASVPYGIPVPVTIDRSHTSPAYVTLGFADASFCTDFIKAAERGYHHPTTEK